MPRGCFSRSCSPTDFSGEDSSAPANTVRASQLRLFISGSYQALLGSAPCLIQLPNDCAYSGFIFDDADQVCEVADRSRIVHIEGISQALTAEGVDVTC